jgi:hypothetical protein
MIAEDARTRLIARLRASAKRTMSLPQEPGPTKPRRGRPRKTRPAKPARNRETGLHPLLTKQLWKCDDAEIVERLRQVARDLAHDDDVLNGEASYFSWMADGIENDDAGLVAKSAFGWIHYMLQSQEQLVQIGEAKLLADSKRSATMVKQHRARREQ